MIRRAILTLSAVILLGLIGGTTASAAGWSISAFGGGAMPMGDFADEDLADAQTGYQFGGALDYHLNDMWAVGIDASYVKNTHGAEGETIDLGGGASATYTYDKFTTTQFGVHAMATLPGTGPWRFHGLLGAGSYSTQEKWEGTIDTGGFGTITDNDESDTQTGFGFRLGAGAMYAMNPKWGLGVDVDYNVVSEDEDEVGFSSLQYVGLKGVLRYMLSSGGGQ
jgi:opacity protein-like surface antigen